ncbi:MAG: BREX-3 system phosphatase PglZ [Bacillus sp. (in: Bacteria)]|nr:BREX-3 system phosphatase PglZ [Bacillus sp. (in: firmicutes)]
MKAWRQLILDKLNVSVYPLILVADRDDLLSDEELILYLQENSIHVHEAMDRAEMRFIFEQFKEGKGVGEKLLFKYLGDEAEFFPYDFLTEGHFVSLSVSEIFPAFPSFIVRELDAHVRDALDEAATSLPRGKTFTSRDAFDFLLRKVYKLSYDLVDSDGEWLSLLVKLNEHPLEMPMIVKEYLREYIGANTSVTVELVELVFDKEKLLDFLQQEWEEMVRHCWEEGYEAGLEWEPLKHLLPMLFSEGKLHPVTVDGKGGVKDVPHWLKYGLKERAYSPVSDIHQIVEKLHGMLDGDVSYKQWIAVMELYSYGKELTLAYDLGADVLLNVEKQMNEKFKNWMTTEYKALSSLSYYHNPVMVHQIIPYMQLQEEKKQVLIVMDGMGFVQWKQLKRALGQVFSFNEQGVFAWVPTVTEISRNAIFQGKIPKFQDNSSEEKAWKLQWVRQGISPLHITFENKLAQGIFQREDVEALKSPSVKKAAIILRNMDVLMHGAIQGMEGLHAEIDVWLNNGYLKELLEELLKASYDVYMTSDHGSTESVGIGRLKQGSLVETKGERVRIYSNKVFRDEAAAEVPSIIWPNEAFSEGQHFLLAETEEAFVTKGKQIISHGGITLEEVVVPFVKVKRKRG